MKEEWVGPNGDGKALTDFEEGWRHTYLAIPSDRLLSDILVLYCELDGIYPPRAFMPFIG